jgi:hypothetical protein
MILSGQASGWGCGCDDDDDDNQDVVSNIASTVYERYSIPKNIQITTVTENNIDPVKSIKEKNSFNGLLSLYFLYRESNDDFTDVSKINTDLFEWQLEQINAKNKERFGEKNVKKIENVNIAELSFVEQIQMIGLMIDVLSCFDSPEVTIDVFSKNLLYSARKKFFNGNVAYYHAADLTIMEKSRIKQLFLIIRNSIFESLTRYVYEYLNLGYEKFGSAFYNKDINKEISFASKTSSFYAKDVDSDKNDYLAKFLNDKDVVAITFSDINFIKEKISTLPAFKDVFEANDSVYLLKDQSLPGEYKAFVAYMQDKYNLSAISKAKGHMATVFNFFNCETKGQNDPNKSGKTVTKTVFELLNLESIDEATTVKFKNGIKVDNIVFDVEE